MPDSHKQVWKWFTLCNTFLVNFLFYLRTAFPHPLIQIKYFFLNYQFASTFVDPMSSVWWRTSWLCLRKGRKTWNKTHMRRTIRQNSRSDFFLHLQLVHIMTVNSTARVKTVQFECTRGRLGKKRSLLNHSLAPVNLFCMNLDCLYSVNPLKLT